MAASPGFYFNTFSMRNSDSPPIPVVLSSSKYTCFHISFRRWSFNFYHKILGHAQSFRLPRCSIQWYASLHSQAQYPVILIFSLLPFFLLYPSVTCSYTVETSSLGRFSENGACLCASCELIWKRGYFQILFFHPARCHKALVTMEFPVLRRCLPVFLSAPVFKHLTAFSATRQPFHSSPAIEISTFSVLFLELLSP